MPRYGDHAPENYYDSYVPRSESYHYKYPRYAPTQVHPYPVNHPYHQGSPYRDNSEAHSPHLLTHPIANEEEDNDFLVMGRPGQGKRHGKTHEQVTLDPYNVDIELPVSKGLNVDPPIRPPERGPEPVYKQIPIAYPEQREKQQEGYMVAHPPPDGKHAPPTFTH